MRSALGTQARFAGGFRALVGLSGALALAGCIQGAQPELPSRSRSIPLEDAFVSAPVGGPEVTSVVQERYPNATEQRIFLANRSLQSGSNYLQVQYFGPVGNSGTGRTPLANSRLATADLRSEIRAAVPGVQMVQSPLFVQNRYGPFGYAAGRAPNGDVCVYTWQRIAGVDRRTLLLRDRGTIQIRLRLCDRAAGEERLLYSMYGLTIRAFFSNLSWNPYGDPNMADPRFGGVGQPILPVGARGFEPATGVVAAPAPAQASAPPPRRRSAPARPAAAPAAQPAVAAPAPVQQLPAPIGPLVPPPPAAATIAPAAGGSAASTSSAAESAAAVPPPPSTCAPADRQAGTC